MYPFRRISRVYRVRVAVLTLLLARSGVASQKEERKRQEGLWFNTGRVRQSQATRCGGNSRCCLEMVSELTQSLVSIGRHPASLLPKSRPALPIVTDTRYLEANQSSSPSLATFPVTVVTGVSLRTNLRHTLPTDYVDTSVACNYPGTTGIVERQRYVHLRRYRFKDVDGQENTSQPCGQRTITSIIQSIFRVA